MEFSTRQPAEFAMNLPAYELHKDYKARGILCSVLLFAPHRCTKNAVQISPHHYEHIYR